MMHSMSDVGSLWMQAHTPLHVLTAALFIIGIVAAAIWLAKAEAKTVLWVSIVSIALSILLGYPLTGAWRTMDMGENMGNGQMMSPDMMKMMQMMEGMSGNTTSSEATQPDEHHPGDAVPETNQ